eukprot:187568_1
MVASAWLTFVLLVNMISSFRSQSLPMFMNAPHTKPSTLNNTPPINILHSSDRILVTTINDVWYIPVIVLFLVLLCWSCCGVILWKCKSRYSIGEIHERNSDDIADIELEELNIDIRHQSVSDPAKYKNRTNKKHSASHHGALVYQKQYFSTAQLKYIKEMNIKCLILFGDNDTDHRRKNDRTRKHFGGQAAVLGKYDRSIGYGVITTFSSRKTPKLGAFHELMNEQFEPLKKYLVSGYDVIVPYPSKHDLTRSHHMYHEPDHEGHYKQLVYHNLGTGIAELSFAHVYYMQRKIMELEYYASRIKLMDYYGYNPKMQNSECPLCNQLKAFLITFTNCKHKICETCLKQYIDDNLKAYIDNNIDIKMECWAVKLNKCNGNLCLKDINYPKGTSKHLHKTTNGTILDGNTYMMFRRIMSVYSESLCTFEKDICPNEQCLKPFRVIKEWQTVGIDDESVDSSDSNHEIDSSGSIAAGKIFHCNCCGHEIHGVQYFDEVHSSDDDLLEQKYNANVFFDIFWCNICDKKFCRKCREYCFYSLEIPIKYNMKTPEPITQRLSAYQENEELDCCEICWYTYFCRDCPHCQFRFCGVCHGAWNGVTKISKEQQIIFRKLTNTFHGNILSPKEKKALCIVKGGKERHDVSMHHSCKKTMQQRNKRKSERNSYENAVKNEEIKTLKIKLAGVQQKNEILQSAVKEMKHEMRALEERKEFETKKTNDIAKIEKKIAKIEKKMKKINKEAIWEWNDSEHIWRLYDTETIKRIEKLKIGQHFEYTLLANNQTYRITKLSKLKGQQENVNTCVRRCIRRTERDKNSEAVKYPSFWAHIDKTNSYVSDGSYAKPHFSKLRQVNHEKWREISEKFYETVDESVRIIDIETVENRFLWDKFFHVKYAMKKLMGEHNINERELWHGTNCGIIDVICTEGFRKEFNNKHAYGEGTYFARDAIYSVSYAEQSRWDNRCRMFLCKVLCGESVRGSNGITLQEWPKKHGDELIYDSLVDDIQDPTIFVIHDDIRAYPMYIVHFTK